MLFWLEERRCYAQNKQPEEALDNYLKAVAANNNDFTTTFLIKSR
jgi:hypothetical protein